jgi:hypothetical protein
MTTDVTFLQILVDERRSALLAEADSARLARLSRRWRRALRPPTRSPVHPEEPAAQCRVPATR